MSKKKHKKAEVYTGELQKGKVILSVVIGVIITAVITLGVNYLWPTPWNIHSIACWLKVILILIIFCVVNAITVCSMNRERTVSEVEDVISVPILFPVIVLVGLIFGACTGAQIFHSDDYANIIQVEEVESTALILSEEDASSIALMDTASATQLGDREVGAIENFSAFDVSYDYIQLNVNGDAVKISPLEYAGFFKWMKNKDKGVTGYVTVSPTTMTADYIELKEGMKYVPSACFSQDLNRLIHKKFPTLIYDNIHFEVDEKGNPYYIASVYEKTIGLFGGEIITGAIIVDPVTGEAVHYDLENVPTWVDNVVHGDLICDLYNLAYKNKNGYWNGTFLGANTGCMQTTTVTEVTEDEEEEEEEETTGTDYGYIAKDDDIYIYTGVTSMAADSSNLGFIMVNERTGEYKFFAVSGANEQSAMNAAEGEVQQYNYTASFPTLINVDEELTYLGVLKDNSGLVKMYYMVNVKDYGKVVVASSREECVQKYADKLGLQPDKILLDSMEGDGTTTEDDSKEEVEKETVSFEIQVMEFIDVDGNTYVYMGTPEGKVYKALFAENEQLLFAKAGDKVTGAVAEDVFTLETIETPQLQEEGNQENLP